MRAVLLGMRRRHTHCPPWRSTTRRAMGSGEAEAAALFVERGTVRIVCGLYAAVRSDDEYGEFTSSRSFEPPVVSRPCRRLAVRAKWPENRVEAPRRRAASTDERRAPNLAADLHRTSRSADSSHTLGHILYEWK